MRVSRDVAALATFVIVLVAWAGLALAADARTAAEVRKLLSATPAGQAPNLSGANLSRLDLSGVAFRGANMARANLVETLLVEANLSKVRLDGANLSSARMDRADVRSASLRGALLLTTATGANFEGSDLSFVSGYLIAPNADFRAARIVHAKLASDMSNQPMGLLHTIMARADLSRADLSFSDFSFADLHAARFHNAELRGVRFRGADLSRADLRSADVSGADFSEAEIAGTIFIGVRGRSSMKGLASAHDRDQAVFQ